MKQTNLPESSLGVQRFNRTPRDLTLTDAGKSRCQDAKHIIQYAKDAQLQAIGLPKASPSGGAFCIT